MHTRVDALNVRPVINHHLNAASRVTSAVVYARQELVSSHIDLLTSLRDPEIRRVDGSVHHHQSIRVDYFKSGQSRIRI